MVSFETEWNQRYGEYRPVGFALRIGGARHWVRFHALPESKRYAETEAERAVVLARMNTLAMAVLGNASCWIVQATYRDPEAETDKVEHLWPPAVTLHLPVAFQFEGSDDEACGEGLWIVHALECRWATGRFDQTLEAIADDTAAKTLWMSRSTGAVFAPYDGGADLFLPTAAEVDRLKVSHSDWLSTYPPGL